VFQGRLILIRIVENLAERRKRDRGGETVSDRYNYLRALAARKPGSAHPMAHPYASE